VAQSGLSRRQVLALAGAAGGAFALPAAAQAGAAGDPTARLYHRILLLHTRWVEQQWDARLRAYRPDAFRFTAVLGNAVLLTTDGYDADLAGVDRVTLRAHTLATIKRYAADNRLAGGTAWGKQLFPDSTFQLYFVLAARLLWDQLEIQTRADVLAIAAGQAAYTYGLNTGDDPLSPGRTPNGRQGGWIGDSKLADMGGYAQALAPGVAWMQDRDWLDRFTFWMSNATGLPVADRANPAVAPNNTAHNIHDTFVVERGGAVDPHGQAEIWRIAGRAAAHFLIAGRPLPPVLTRLPNGRELWATLLLLTSDAGEPVMPMTTNGYHQYAQDVLPLAFLAQIQGDRYAARAEADLAARLLPYLRYRPGYRLAKFGGDEPDEPEARAQLAIAYLLHRGTPTQPVPRAEFLRAAAGTRAFGDDLGLTVHQSANAFAAAVTKKGFANFLWQPRRDDWLVDTSAVGFLPPSAHPPTEVSSTAYQKNRDGLDATATVLRFGDIGAAGFTTLPTGTVVYASTGIGTDEGGLTLFNLTMPGVPGLTGRRTFTGASGSVTLAGSRGGGGNGGTDELAFPSRQARYVRMLGRQAASEDGYSIWSFGVLDGAGADLAQGAVATGSSADVTYPAYNATDGNSETRWAVAPDQRRRVDSWLAIDLGSVVTIAGVRLRWEAAYGTRYVIQTSIDAQRWTDVVTVPDAHTLTGGWVDIDGRAGLVTLENGRSMVVTATSVIAAHGPAAEVTVEGYARSSVDLAAAARRRLPVSSCGLRISDADGYLSVFNLTEETVANAVIWLPTCTRLYRGTHVARDGGLEWTVTQAAGTALVEPPRFTVEGTVPDGARFTVPDSQHLTVSAPERAGVAVTVRSGSWNAAVTVAPGEFIRLVVPGGPVTPTSDLARGRTTFPTSPLPAGMTAPGLAVDGDPRTAWRPGPSGRMVVDLGAVCDVSAVRLTWTDGWVCPARLESSADGLTYTSVNQLPEPARVGTTAVNLSARYLAVTVVGWRPGNAELAELAVFGVSMLFSGP
jgi:hypothetical protein